MAKKRREQTVMELAEELARQRGDAMPEHLTAEEVEEILSDPERL